MSETLKCRRIGLLLGLLLFEFVHFVRRDLIVFVGAFAALRVSWSFSLAVLACEVDGDDRGSVLGCSLFLFEVLDVFPKEE